MELFENRTSFQIEDSLNSATRNLQIVTLFSKAGFPFSTLQEQLSNNAFLNIGNGKASLSLEQK